MIFQPTNIIPSSIGNLGDGTVDVTDGLNVSWMVNGNSAMTAFEITVYQNNVESTELFSTGKLADNCPFYGVSYDGEQQYFSYTIPYSELLSSGIVNGSEYKLVITQYWGENEENFIVQTSASAFITRSTPKISLIPIISPLASKEYTFYGVYTQDQGDALNWIRWQVALADNIDNPIFDTGNIYGTAELRLTYDGFITENNYSINLMIQTENGVFAETGWQTFEVRYATSGSFGKVTAKCIKGKSGIKVSWPLLSYIPGNASGNYDIKGQKKIVFDYGTNITWNEQNGNQLNFNAPFSVIFKGKVLDADAELFALNTTKGRLVLKYDFSAEKIALFNDAKELLNVNNIAFGTEVSAVVTPESAFLRTEFKSGGLYPNNNIFPSLTFYPKENAFSDISTTGNNISYDQGDIKSIGMSGRLIAEYLQILSVGVSDVVINSVIEQNNYIPEFSENTYFLLDFTDGINGGNVKGTGSQLVGLSVYRQQGKEANLEKIANLTPEVNMILDYAVESQQGPYTYYIFPKSTTTYISSPLVSEGIFPCFWNWIILSCSERNDGSFEVEEEYIFGKNLSSGSVNNNNTPGIFNNFTAFPTVQTTPQNYQSGTLSSLIGFINSNGKYSDTISLRNAIWNLSITKNELFLKNRKGDFFPIKIAGPIGMETLDNTKEQAQNASIPWIQTGEGNNISVYALPTDDFFVSSTKGEN